MKQVLVLAIYSKFLIYLIIFLASSLLPYSREYYEPNFIYPPGEKHSIISAYKSWDAQHYLFLIEQGYQPGNISNGFFPAYPLLASVLNIVLQNGFLSGFLVANIASIVGIVYFYRFLKQFFSKHEIFWVILLLLSFPTSYYFSFMYSEAVFFALLTSCFYYLYKRDFLLTGLISLFIPFARPVGIFIIFPLLVFILSDKKRDFKEISFSLFSKPLSLKYKPAYTVVIFPVLGVLLYFFFMSIATGNPFSGIQALHRNISTFELERLLSPALFFQSLFPQELSLHSFHTSVIDRSFFLLFLLLLPFIYKYFDKTLFTFSLALGMVPLLGSFMAYPRYLLIVFPIYMVIVRIFPPRKYQTVLIALVFLFLSIQIFFIVLYALNYWVF